MRVYFETNTIQYQKIWYFFVCFKKWYLEGFLWPTNITNVLLVLPNLRFEEKTWRKDQRSRVLSPRYTVYKNWWLRSSALIPYARGHGESRPFQCSLLFPFVFVDTGSSSSVIYLQKHDKLAGEWGAGAGSARERRGVKVRSFPLFTEVF